MRKRCFGISLISGILVLNLFGLVGAEEKTLMDEMRIIKQGEGEVQKKKDDKVIEKYYYKKEIIKEVPEEQGKYEKHLWEELKKKLKKPKKLAEIWRVEGDLIELNKGSIHKVREGDVYAIYGKDGKYKGKMEVGAIADAVSIGQSLKKKNNMRSSDIAKYLGQRRFWGMGILYGKNIVSKDKFLKEDKNYEAYGVYWRLLFKKGYGVGISLINVSRNSKAILTNDYFGDKVDNYPDAWNTYLDVINTGPIISSKYRHSIYVNENFSFKLPVDIRKYFFHPCWYTLYAGMGGAYFEAEYNMTISDNMMYNPSSKKVDEIKNEIVPVLTGGIELTLSQYLRLVVSGYYFHGPQINIEGYKPLTRPLVLSVSFVGSW